MSPVSWSSISSVGGSLNDEKLRNEMTKIINEFGNTLENKCTEKGINKFVFTIFKPFNIIGILTKNTIFFAFSTLSGGTSSQLWHDFRDNIPEPTIESLNQSIAQQLGWDKVWYVHFPLNIIEMDSNSREKLLTQVADNAINTTILQAEKNAKLVRINPIFQGREFSIEDNLCFVIMSFRENFDRIYKNNVKPIATKLDYRVLRADDIFTPTVIIEDIWEQLNKAKFIIADVTGRNPNVFYELGIAHTIGKKVIMITQNEDDIPFDVKHIRHFKYADNENGWTKLESDLENSINAI
jgi:hypothetical protein